MPPLVLLAGPTGDVGARILRALLTRGASVRALLRADAPVQDHRSLVAAGATVATVATVATAASEQLGSLTAACRGATCVVSALNGLRDVIVERQSLLLDAAVAAGVPRFIPSDYAADFTRTRPGDNRNFDLRREFMARAARAPLAVTSVLNGAFMDMLGAQMPLIQPSIRRVLYWHDADQRLDFTAKDDVARYVAAVALDSATPRWLRIAGDTVSSRQIAAAMTEVTGERYRPLWVGSLGSLGLTIRLAKLFAPQPEVIFPPWQGMQYLRDMFSGRARLQPLDNERYPGLRWTSVRERLAARFGPTGRASAERARVGS